MDRYIDTGKAIEKISTITIKGGCTDAYEAGINKGLDIATEIINHTPTADVEPVKHGKWILVESYDPREHISRCSCCGETETWTTKYCPSCGARMNLESEG